MNPLETALFVAGNLLKPVLNQTSKTIDIASDRDSSVIFTIVNCNISVCSLLDTYAYGYGRVLTGWIRHKIEIPFGASKPHVIGPNIVYIPAVWNRRQKIHVVELAPLCLMDGTHKYGLLVEGDEVLYVRLKDVFTQVTQIVVLVGCLKV